MAKPDIKKMIQNQPKRTSSLHGKGILEKSSPFAGNPLFTAAQGAIENMSTPWKLAIGGAIWLLVSGIAANIYSIYKLISLAF